MGGQTMRSAKRSWMLAIRARLGPAPTKLAPNNVTRGSSPRISSSAAASAWVYSSSRGTPASGACWREHELRRLVGRRLGAGQGEVDGGSHFPRDLRIRLLQILAGDRVSIEQAPRVQKQRIAAFYPAPDRLWRRLWRPGPVQPGLATHRQRGRRAVAAWPARSARLDEPRSVALARGGDRSLRRVQNLIDVGAVDHVGSHAVRPRNI